MRSPRFLIGTLFLLIASHLQAQQITLRPNQSAGDVYNFDQVMSMQLSLTMSAQGQTQQMQQNVGQNRSGKVQVLEAQSGEPTKAIVTFDNNCGGFMEMQGQGKQEQPFALTGKTVNVTRQTDGSYKVEGEMGEGANEVENYIKMEAGMFPKNPVAPGDIWDVAPEELAKAMQMDPTAKVSAHGKLLSVENTGGRQVANVEMVINMAGNQPGAGQMTIGLSGTVKLDVATGRTVGGSLTGPVTMAGQPQPGVDVNGKGVMTFTFKGSVAGGGGAVVNPNPNPNPFPNPTPVPAPNPGPNPFDPGAGAASLAGQYTGEKLSMDLKPAGAGYEGTITMKGNTYPCTATAQGNNLTGKFTAGGNSFDFTASVTGDAMTFKTGSSTYDLKKKSAAKNPLE